MLVAGTKLDQLPHGDGEGEPGHHHGVLPATPGYNIHVYPGTHLLQKSLRDAKNGLCKVNRSQQKTLSLGVGDLLVFHSSLGHAGAKLNDTNAKKSLEIRQNLIDITWFSGANEGTRVTDLAIHFDVEDKILSGEITFERAQATGATEQLRLKEDEDYIPGFNGDDNSCPDGIDGSRQEA